MKRILCWKKYSDIFWPLITKRFKNNNSHQHNIKTIFSDIVYCHQLIELQSQGCLLIFAKVFVEKWFVVLQHNDHLESILRTDLKDEHTKKLGRFFFIFK